MFSFFPFTNFHEMNTDWVIKTIKAWEVTMKEYAERVEAAVASIAHAVLTTPQTLTASEQTQARANISAASTADTTQNREYSEWVNNRVNGIETQVYVNTGNINGLRDRMTAAESAIAEKADADDVESGFDAVDAALAAIKTPHIVTLSYENSAFALSESVTNIVGWISDGDSVIINAQGVGEYPGNPYPSTAEVQIADLKTATIAAADAVEGTVTLSIGTAQEIKMTMSAGAQNPDSVNVVFNTVPIGGSVQPVTVTLTENNGVWTWSGATWAEFYNAFNHGCAFANIDGGVYMCVRAVNTGNLTAFFTSLEANDALTTVELNNAVILSDGSAVVEAFTVKKP